MTLIQAEGYARNADLTSAVQYLNELRKARNSNLYNLTGKNQPDVMELINQQNKSFGHFFSHR